MTMMGKDNNDVNTDENYNHENHKFWNSYKTVAYGLDKSNLSKIDEYQDIIASVKYVLWNWHTRWVVKNKSPGNARREWYSFLNKSKLCHEVEEAIVALHHLRTWLNEKVSLDRGSNTSIDDASITVIDLCSGKGVFSMLLTYLAGLGIRTQNDDNHSNNVTYKEQPHAWCSVFCTIGRCIMIDRMDINWKHISAANEDVVLFNSSCREQGSGSSMKPISSILNERGDIIENYDDSILLAKIPIDTWPGTNIHDDEVLERINTLPGRIAIVGIHLCKGLSPRAIGITNICGPQKIPFLCLAPCCLPRLNAGHLCIPVHEEEEGKKKRLAVEQRRNRIRKAFCSICNEKNHFARHCPLLPTDPEQRLAMLAKHQVCWKCGALGHEKQSCTGKRPLFIPPPSVTLDLNEVKNALSPFDTYCERLLETIEVQNDACSNISTVPLEGDADLHEHNSIGQRKCTWLTLQCS